MIKKPETYEEAKIILSSKEAKEVDKYHKKMAIRRMKLWPTFLFTSLNALTAIPAYYYQDPKYFTAGATFIIPLTLSVLAVTVSDYIKLKKYEESLNDGSYIANNNKETVMKQAAAYVDDYYGNKLDKRELDKMLSEAEEQEGVKNDEHVASR